MLTEYVSLALRNMLSSTVFTLILVWRKQRMRTQEIFQMLQDLLVISNKFRKCYSIGL